MKQQYSAKTIEKKWQDLWEERFASQASDQSDKEKCYVLDMFPYPSGDGLHVGHVENYTATDIYSRFKRLKGFEVLHPIGWDAFGLPAENFAIKTGVHPDEKTHQNIANFTRQIKSLGISYDWSRVIDTSSPEYYKWTQWLFLFLYKNGLAYRKQASVNWCPSCQTVLANEQVVDGVCERCKTEVIQKNLKQWFFKITDFIEDQKGQERIVSGLLSGLQKINWPESTKKAQQHWIGRSEGALVKFAIRKSSCHAELVSASHTTSEEILKQVQDDNLCIEVFTTRVDTIFGCTYVVVAPEHDFVKKLLLCHSREGGNPGSADTLDPRVKPEDDNTLRLQNSREVKQYLEETKKKTELERTDLAKKKTELERTDLAKEKTGVKLDGIEAINPFTGEAVPVYVADYVLGNYGTGAVMAVPAHDERDLEFAKKYSLPIKVVVKNKKDFDQIDSKKLKSFTKTLFEKAEDEQFLAVMIGGAAKAIRENGVFGVHSDIDVFVDDRGFEIMERYFSENGYDSATRDGKSDFHQWNNHKWFWKEGVWIDLFLLERDGDELFDNVGLEKCVWGNRDNLVKVDFEGVSVNIPSEEVLEKIDFTLSHNWNYCFTDSGILTHSGEFDGLTSEEAREKMAAWLEEKKLGGKKVNYRLRDWLVSRQRYWGAPIPIIYCDTCGEQPVPEQDLPVKLPTDVDFRPTGESPLTRSESFHDMQCPKCGEKARRESDTMDTFVCSSWYYLRFADPKNTEVFVDAEKLQKWLPVDVYMGGAEHTVLHLLYARFFAKALCKYGLLDFDEPFLKLKHQGMVLAEDGRKMSKSLGNVVNPDDVVGQFGADSLRLYEMFMGPLEDSKAWKTDNLVGPRRFLEKVWRMGSKITINNQQSTENDQQKAESNTLQTLLHKTIQKVTHDIEEFHFNTCISSLMVLANEMDRQKSIAKSDFESLLLLLSPFAPHIAEELWESIGNTESIFESSWPKVNPAYLKDKVVDIVVQVNGKLRGKLSVTSDSEQKDVEALALQDEKVVFYTQGRTIKKVIFVPNRLINIVVTD